MKIFKYLIVVSAIYAISGCAKTEEFNNTDTKVGQSRVTFFAELVMSGSDVMSVVKGTTFTDPGITATEGEKTIPVVTTGTVNTGEVGLYQLTYTATNTDGFPATAHRTVIVIPEAEKPGTDISGEYSAIGGAPSNAVVTKVGAGIYYTTNCWGGGSLAVIPAYFICTDGATASIPLQDLGLGYGRIVTQNPGTYVNGLITWTVSRLDFGPPALTLQKQWQKL